MLQLSRIMLGRLVNAGQAAGAQGIWTLVRYIVHKTMPTLVLISFVFVTGLFCYKCPFLPNNCTAERVHCLPVFPNWKKVVLVCSDAKSFVSGYCPVFFETSKKKMYVASVPCPAMYYTDMIYRSNDRGMPKHKRNCTEKGRLTYVTNSSENNLCLCEVNFSFQSKERYCDPSIENCTCRRNTPDSKNKEDASDSWKTIAIVVTLTLTLVIIVIITGICIWWNCRDPKDPERKKEDEVDTLSYQNDDDRNDVDLAESGINHSENVFHSVQETAGGHGPNPRDRYYGDVGDVGGYAESQLLLSGSLTVSSEKEHASIVSPVVGTDDVYTGNMNNVIPMESAMETSEAEINLEWSQMIQCDGILDCEEPYQTLNTRRDNGERNHFNDL